MPKNAYNMKGGIMMTITSMEDMNLARIKCNC